MTQRLRSTAGDFQIRILCRKFCERHIQTALYVLCQLDAVKADALYFFTLGKGQDGAVGLHHAGDTGGKVLYEFRQPQRRTQFQHHFHQALCAFSMLI